MTRFGWDEGRRGINGRGGRLQKESDPMFRRDERSRSVSRPQGRTFGPYRPPWRSSAVVQSYTVNCESPDGASRPRSATSLGSTSVSAALWSATATAMARHLRAGAGGRGSPAELVSAAGSRRALHGVAEAAQPVDVAAACAAELRAVPEAPVRPKTPGLAGV